MSVLNFLELAEGGEALPQRSVAALDFDGKVPVSSPRPVTALDLSEKVSASSPTRPKTKPTITKPTAPSELLQRLSAFLPEIQRANDELSQKDSRTFNIEFDEESEAEQMIELVILLGCFLSLFV